MTPLIVSKNPNGSIRWSFVWPKDEPCPQTLQIASEGLTLFVFSHREPKGREEWYVYRALQQEEIKQVSLKRGTTLLLMKQNAIVWIIGTSRRKGRNTPRPIRTATK